MKSTRSSEEIEHRLNPQHEVFKLHLVERGTHRVDADETIDSERGREDIREEQPELRHIALRPYSARDKEENDAEEDEYHNTAVTMTDKTAYRHAEEYGGKQERYDEKDYMYGVANVWQVEKARQDYKIDDRHREIDEEIGQRATHRHAEKQSLLTQTRRDRLAHKTFLS